MIYLQLLWVYLKIGMFGFGGGYAMLSLIQHEIVDLHHWLTPQQFTDVVAISQMTPGPIGINSATYVGYAVTQSVWGAVLATVAVCLPSFILVLLISYFFAKCKDNKYIKAAMSGLPHLEREDGQRDWWSPALESAGGDRRGGSGCQCGAAVP